MDGVNRHGVCFVSVFVNNIAFVCSGMNNIAFACSGNLEKNQIQKLDQTLVTSWFGMIL